MICELVRNYRQTLKVLGTLHIVNYDWPRNSPEIALNRKTRWSREIYLFNVGIHVIYVLSMAINLVLTFNISSKTFFGEVLGLQLFMLYLGALLTRMSFIDKDNGVVRFIRSLLLFENNKSLGSQDKRWRKLIKLLLNYTFAGYISVIFCVGLIVYFNPCAPPFSGSIIFQRTLSNENCHVPNYIWKITLILFDCYMCVNCLWCTEMFIHYILIVGVCCINSYLRFIQLGLTQIPQHKGVIPTRKRFMQVIQSYNQVRLISIEYNGLLQHGFLPVIISFTCLPAILGVFVAIKLHRVLSTAELFFIFNVIVGCFLILSCLGICAKALHLSSKFEKFVNQRVDVLSRPLYRKISNSLNAIKVHITSSNFIESQTPFNCIEFCLENAINLILLAM